MQRPNRNSELAAEIARDGRRRYEIAAQAKMVPGTLSGIVSGAVKPTPSQQRRIAGVLGKFAHELFPIDDSDGDA